MAGQDTGFFGEARPARSRSGFLPQEPQLDRVLDVKGNVELGVGQVRDLLDRFNEVSNQLGEPMTPTREMEKLLAEQAKLQDAIDAPNGWELDRTLEMAMDALRLPPGDAGDDGSPAARSAGWRCAASCWSGRTCSSWTSPPTTWTPSRGLAGAVPPGVPGHRRGHHPRPLLPGQRGGWILELDRGEGVPVGGQLLTWLEQKQKRLALEEKAESARQKTPSASWSGCAWPQGPPGEEQGPARRLREAARGRPGRSGSPDILEITIPPGPRWAAWWWRPTRLRKAYGDQLLIDDLTFKLPPGGIVGVIGPNGAGKTTLFRMIIGQEKPDAGELRSARR